METKIIKQEKNPFLQREEFEIKITAKGVPSSEEVVEKIGKDKTLTVVKKINTNFGRQEFMAEILVYDNIKAKEKIETIPQKIRKKIAAEKKEAEAKAKKEAEAAKKAEEAAEAEKNKENKSEAEASA